MAWYHRLINIARPNQLSRDIDRELAFHIAERVDELMSSGMTEAEASRLARRQFGNYTLQTERTRDMDVMTWLESIISDIRYAVRAMRASKALTGVAILSLALGIGANTAIFSLIDSVLLKTLPVEHPEQLLQVKIQTNSTFTNPIWEQLRDHQDVFSAIFAFANPRFNLSTGGESRPANGNWVSGDFFSTLGVGAIIGRTLNRNDDRRGGPGVAMLSYSFWQREYGGDRSVLGKTISLDEHPFEIVGVTEPGFYGLEVGSAAEVFAPIACEAIVDGEGNMLDHRSAWWLEVIGRPKPGINPEQVQARLKVLAPDIFAATLPSNWRPENQQRYLKYTFNTQPAESGGFSSVRSQYSQALLVLMIVCAAVLLVACANVSNLLLARAGVRQREIAIRLALGSGRRRLVRQLLTESLLLSAAGALLGLLFAHWGSRLLVGLLSSSGRRVFLDLSLDGRVLLFTTAVAFITGILFGLAPAWRSARMQLLTAIKANGRCAIEGHSRFRLGKGLVVVQVAMSLVLVVGAGLMLGTFQNLATLDPGFQRDHILLARLDLRNSHYPEERRAEVFHDILNHLRSTPGVVSASSSMLTPVGNIQWDDDIAVAGYTPSSRGDTDVYFNRVSDRYFETFGTPLLTGRDFNSNDTPESTKVAIVNEALAKKFFGTSSPVGQTLQVQTPATLGPPIEIVGVVKDAKYQSLRQEAPPTAYVPASQEPKPGPFITFELRGNGPASGLIPSTKAAIAAVDHEATLGFVPLATQLSESLTRERLLATLSGFFGGLALLLAAIGLYGVMSYNVTRRRNEIGIRMALGAERGRLVAMILGEVGILVAAGLLIGLGAAFATTRFVSSLLYGLKPTDTATFTVSALVLLAVALVAGFLPAHRASQVDPMAALRDE